MVKNSEDLRGMLLSTIEDVREGKIDFKKAGAISSLSGKILYSAKLDMDFAKLLHMGGKGKARVTVASVRLSNGKKSLTAK